VSEERHRSEPETLRHPGRYCRKVSCLLRIRIVLLRLLAGDLETVARAGSVLNQKMPIASGSALLGLVEYILFRYDVDVVEKIAPEESYRSDVT
jgi:hypothetical protein